MVEWLKWSMLVALVRWAAMKNWHLSWDSNNTKGTAIQRSHWWRIAIMYWSSQPLSQQGRAWGSKGPDQSSLVVNSLLSLLQSVVKMLPYSVCCMIWGALGSTILVEEKIQVEEKQRRLSMVCWVIKRIECTKGKMREEWGQRVGRSLGMDVRMRSGRIWNLYLSISKRN